MAQRHIQLFRNGTPSFDALRNTHAKVVEYLLGVDSPLTGLTVRDGELVLYRYQLTQDGDIHTIVLAVSFPEGGTKTFEVVANYDHLTNLITDLNAEVTDSNEDNDITVRVKQEAGLLTEVELTDSLAEVAHTGNAADVAVADAGNIIKATTVEGALAEIAAEIDAMDTTHTPGNLVKVNFTQTDGKVTTFTTDESALEARLEALEDNTIAGENAIVVTPEMTEGENSTATGSNTISLKIAENEKVLSQSTDGLTSTLNLTYDSTAKAIKLWGISNETPIATVDATNFIKDGMLADATIVSGTWAEGNFTESETGTEKAIKFVWKTYQQGQDGQEEVLKTEYLNVESLVDAYTAGNEWVVINPNSNTISHKTVDGLDSTNTHGITADVTVDSTTTKTFNVPSLKVDAAGHVTSVDEKTVTITLPASIDTAVQTVTSTETVNATDKFVAVHATRAEGNNDVVLTSELEIQDIATATATDNGLATALNVKEYVTANSTTVSGYTKITGEGDSAVSTVVTEVGKTTNENGSTNYQVKLPEITVQTPEAETNSMANNTNTHTYMTGIETDGFGRVTKVLTETMTEDIDAGTY